MRERASGALRVALYARVSTDDRDQDPETQLVALRDFARAQGWEVYGEYVDRAPANDLRGRRAWRRLLDDAARRRFAAVLVFKLDRAFRSVKHMHDTLSAWETVGVGFVSAREGFDTHTPLGRLLLNLLASLAEFELDVLRERVRAGMERARRQGKRIGRPSRLYGEDPGRVEELLRRVDEGEWTVTRAAGALGVSRSTVRRLLLARRATAAHADLPAHPRPGDRA